MSMKPLSSCMMVILCLLLSGCQQSAQSAAMHEEKATLFSGLGTHQRVVTTSSSMSQRYFNQGLVWMYGFNHDEAIRSYTAAVRHDPQCAMAWWGIALSNGPHINNPAVPPERAAAAWRALQEAVAQIDHTTPVERALIRALQKRYADTQPEDRAPLERAYAAAMGEVYRQYPNDADVATLYAESLMDLHPWDLWTQDGQPKEDTEEIIRVLERTIAQNPNNPGSHHLYVHAVEAAHPQKALASADQLRRMVPDSSHLVHMPSHIDVLTGNWKGACVQNRLAIDADRAYLRVAPRPGFYRMYMIHNYHMLSFAAMMTGRSEEAIAAATNVRQTVPEDQLRESAWMDGYMGARYDALKRFGRWDELLAEPAPPAYLPITTAMWRFNRGLAFAAKGEVELALQEEQAFQRAVDKVLAEALMAINPAHDILRIARHMLRGEIAFRQGDIKTTISELTSAIAIEDQLRYMEPPEWVQPVRHTLGAVLLADGRYHEAEQVYRQDLREWPGNGWSLYGLARALQSQGKSEEAQRTMREFEQVWSDADVSMTTSCLCIPMR
ncbi:MAG: hypothetical protein HJJLKODD_02414 [Phycisphaerae bacterium]|nr:hypothetical protein [Phycisphaerae bacterium]